MIYLGTSHMKCHISKFVKEAESAPVCAVMPEQPQPAFVVQPAPIHSEYDKNISTKFINILIILKCILLYLFIVCCYEINCTHKTKFPRWGLYLSFHFFHATNQSLKTLYIECYKNMAKNT